ncbi:Protein of unknown function [Gryllus bimaculatus]|nr:Protein of unknown function [Gryllus bimaculatus]
MKVEKITFQMLAKKNSNKRTSNKKQCTLMLREELYRFVPEAMKFCHQYSLLNYNPSTSISQDPNSWGCKHKYLEFLFTEFVYIILFSYIFAAWKVQ